MKVAAGQLMEHERGWVYLVLSVSDAAASDDDGIVVSVVLEDEVFRLGTVFKHSTEGHIMKTSKLL